MGNKLRVIDMAAADSERVGIIERIAGPVVQASNMLGSKLYDVARVGDEKLVGEIIRLIDDIATIQIYESTEARGWTGPQ